MEPKWKRNRPEDMQIRHRIAVVERMMEKMRVAQAAESLLSTKRLIWRNFLSGMARGLGTFLGFAVLAAIIGYILTTAVLDNLPKVANWLQKVLADMKKY